MQPGILALRCFRWAIHRCRQSDLLGIDDFELSLLVVEDHGLPVRADHQVIGVRDDERLPVAEHNFNRLKGFGVHQLFDLIRDHGRNLVVTPVKDNPFVVLPLCLGQRIAARIDGVLAKLLLDAPES